MWIPTQWCFHEEGYNRLGKCVHFPLRFVLNWSGQGTCTALGADYTLGHPILDYCICVVSCHVLLCVFSHSRVHADDREGGTVGTRSLQEGDGFGGQEGVGADVRMEREDRNRLES